MTRPLICDVCRNPTNRIVAKLLLIPTGSNGHRGWNNSAYEAHADIGECCSSRILEQIKWQKRAKNPNKGPKKKKTVK